MPCPDVPCLFFLFFLSSSFTSICNPLGYDRLHVSRHYTKQHQGQICGRKEELGINAVATLLHTIQEKWKKKKLAAALCIDVKKAFVLELRIMLWLKLRRALL